MEIKENEANLIGITKYEVMHRKGEKNPSYEVKHYSVEDYLAAIREDITTPGFSYQTISDDPEINKEIGKITENVFGWSEHETEYPKKIHPGKESIYPEADGKLSDDAIPTPDGMYRVCKNNANEYTVRIWGNAKPDTLYVYQYNSKFEEMKNSQVNLKAGIESGASDREYWIAAEDHCNKFEKNNLNDNDIPNELKDKIDQILKDKMIIEDPETVVKQEKEQRQVSTRAKKPSLLQKLTEKKRVIADNFNKQHQKEKAAGQER